MESQPWLLKGMASIGLEKVCISMTFKKSDKSQTPEIAVFIVEFESLNIVSQRYGRTGK